MEKIPKPENVELCEWLTVYLSIGFMLSTGKPKECLNIFKKHGLVARVIGRIPTKTIQLSYKGQRKVFIILTTNTYLV